MLGFLYRIFGSERNPIRNSQMEENEEENEDYQNDRAHDIEPHNDEDENDNQDVTEHQDYPTSSINVSAPVVNTQSTSSMTAERRSERLQQRRQQLPILQLGQLENPLDSAQAQLDEWSRTHGTGSLQHMSPITCMALAAMGMLRPGQSDLDIRAPVIVLIMRRVSTFTQRVEIVYQNNVLLAFPVSSKVPFEFLSRQHGMMWLMPVEGKMFAFYIRFAHNCEETAWTRGWSTACLEAARSLSMEDALEHPDTDLDWIRNAHDRRVVDEEATVEDEEEEERLDKAMSDMVLQAQSRISTRGTCEALSSEDERDSCSEEDEEDEVENDSSSSIRKSGRNNKARANTKQSSVRNEHLAVSILGDRTFVSRDAQLGMFQHNNRGEMKFLFSLPKITDRENQTLAPKQLMLHDQDHKMLMLSAHDTTRIYEMDLEIGKIVQEYGVSDDFHIGQIAPVTKYAERTPEAVVTAVNNNSVLTLDPRQRGANKLATHFTYQSDTPPQFSCVATTDQGLTVTASRTGAIRLYNDISKRARTTLPGLGDGIIGIDTTADGRWVLATAATYLLLIPTFTLSLAEGTECNGFQSSITSTSTAPIKLQLDPRDVINMNLQSVQFTHAHFNIGESNSTDEEWIVTSTGNYLVTWNMKNVIRRRRYYDYKIKQCDEQVVNNQFIFGQDDTLVVTLPNDLYTEKRVTKSVTKDLCGINHKFNDNFNIAK